MKKALLLFVLMCVALLATAFTQYRLFSLFQAIICIPLLLVLVSPFPVVLAISTVIALEIFSSLPQGSILAMFAIPYLVLLFWKRKYVDLTWKSFFGVVLIVSLQSAALFGILAAMDIQTAREIPWKIILPQILLTSIGTFILAFIYREYSDRL